MSVTPRSGRASCNGEGWVDPNGSWASPGAWCNNPLRYYHYHCEGCGRCLPEVTAFARGVTPDSVREDTRHCSNACRQRAYRERRREAATSEP